jgi:pyrimidine operon attenuation protein / uracil phosphoribosyltransferase
MTKSPKNKILDSSRINRKITRMAWEIHEHTFREKEIFVAGISENGFVLAEKLIKVLGKIRSGKVQLGEIRLNKTQPLKSTIKVSFPVNKLDNKVLVVVDDVLNSGQTLFYSLSPFLKSNLRQIYTAVLINRSYHRFPVKADFIGMSLSTTMHEHVDVNFKKGEEGVFLY